MKAYTQKMKRLLKALPDKKQYVEFVTATLSIPVLVTVIILNLNNLKAKDAKTTTPPDPQTKQVVVTYVPEGSKDIAKTATPDSSSCTKAIGPVSIDSPDEGETVSDNPLDVSVSYTQGNYCAVVWSYRVNDGKWSSYDDKSISLYNLPPGQTRFELRVKSVVTGEERTLTRTFTYAGTTDVVTPATTAAPVGSSSARQ